MTDGQREQMGWCGFLWRTCFVIGGFLAISFMLIEMREYQAEQALEQGSYEELTNEGEQ